PDGRVIATNLDGLLNQILSLGDRVRIESPAEAREKVRQALQRMEQKLRAPPEPPAEPIAQAGSGTLAQPGRAAEPDLKRERRRRLLLIVAAAGRRPGIELAGLAGELGLEVEELRQDIDLLGLVGRPPFSPDDLIDISVDERDRVTVALDQSFSRPPQLTPLE